MNKKSILPVMLAGLAALGLALVSCDNGSTSGPAGNLFILTNISTGQQAAGSGGVFVGLFPSATTKTQVEADITASASDSATTYVIAGQQSTSPLGTSFNTYLYSASSGFNDLWHGAGTYHIWFVLYDGSDFTYYCTKNPVTLTDYGSITGDAQSHFDIET
jgi:hypothetical protein